MFYSLQTELKALRFSLLTVLNFPKRYLKNICLHFLAVFCALLLFGKGYSQTLATYTGSGGSSTTVVAGAANETVGSLQHVGFGTNTACGSGGLSGITVSTAWSSYNPSGPHVYFQILPLTGYQLNVTGFSAVTRESGTGPTKARLAYSLDGGSTWISEGIDHSQTVGASCGTYSNSWSWFGGLTVSAITSTTNGIIVAIYPYTPGGSSGTFQVNSMIVNGNVQCVAPATISGATTICPTAATTLTSTPSGGAWTSGTPSVATVGTGSGVVTGVAFGTSVITYTTLPGCYATATVSVSPATFPIIGPLNICPGTTSTLTDAAPGGVWASANPAAAIGSSTGIVTGVLVDTATITYTTACGVTSAVVTVNPLPASISGPASVCIGSTITLMDATVGGSWSSGSAGVTVGSATGDVTGVTAGGATVTYTLPTGCYTTENIVVNSLPASIAGSPMVCVGAGSTLLELTPGGLWSSSSTGIATVGSTTGVVTGVVTGTANISYTLPTGCFTTFAVTVNPVPLPISGPGSVCMGATITLTDVTPSGTWTGGGGAASVGSASGVVTGVSAGLTTISYVLGTGCFAVYAVTVYPLPAAVSGSPYVCAGASMTLTNITPSGTWSSSGGAAIVGSASGIVSGLSAGISTITYTLPTGCYTTMTVTVSPLPGAISGTSAVCAGSSIILTGPVGGSWSSSSAAATVGSTGVVTGASTGVVTISYTLPSGCYSLKTITVNPSPALFTVSGGGTYCAGGSGAHIMLIGSSPGVSYQLYNGASTVGVALIGTGSNLDFGLQIAVGTYTVVATNIYGCSLPMNGSAAVSITPSPATYTVTGGGSYCAGGAGVHVRLSGSSTGISYQLMNGGTAVGAPLAGIGLALDFGAQTAAGTYTVLASNTTTGCTQTMTGTLLIAISPVPGPISGPSTLCVGATVTLAGSGGGAWTSSSPGVAIIGSASGNMTGLTIGTATISYTYSSTGCFVIKPVTVTISPVAITGPAIACVGTPVTYNDLVPGGLWSSSSAGVATIGSSNGTLLGFTTGTTTITYSLGTGCTVNKTITIDPSPAAITGRVLVCVGTSTTLADVTPGGVWSSGLSTIATAGSGGLVSGLSAGIAGISYTLSTGCAATLPVTVSPFPGSITGLLQACEGSSTVLGNSVSGGTWSSGSVAHATIGSASGIATGVAAGTTPISYTVAPGCAVNASLTVNPLPAPIGGTPRVCVGLSTMLSDITPGGVWSSRTSSTAIVGSSSGIVSGLVPGTDTIYYTLSTTGCVNKVEVSVNPLPGAITGLTSVCVGQSVLLADALSGGTWSSGNPSIATVGSASGNVMGVSVGSVIITYSAGGCIATTTVSVSAAPGPISGPASICIGQTIVMTDASPGGRWTSSIVGVATIGSATGIVSGVSTGTVIISYTLGTGCSVVAPVIVYPVVPIAGNPALCVGQTTHLTDTALGGTWASGNPAIATVDAAGVVTGIRTGTVTVTYTFTSGCTTNVVVTVNSLPSPITGPASVCEGQTISLTDITAGGTWSSSSAPTASAGSTGIVSGLSAGIVTISYTLASGCIAQHLVTVTAVPGTVAGPTDICMGSTAVYTDGVAGGTWSSSATAIVTISTTGGVASGVSAGTATISYTTGSGCTAIKNINVNPLPAAITGPLQMCVGSGAAFSDATTGGIWNSSNTTVATIDPITGIATGMSAGSTVITYSLGTGCIATMAVTVNNLPLAITGNTNVCAGSLDTLSDATAGGTWSTLSSTAAIVGSATGILRGISAGSAVVTYSTGLGCDVFEVLTVNPIPSPVTGPNVVCTGQTIALSNATPGGTWISGSPSVATVNATGVVGGLSAGTALISYAYTATTGCAATQTVTVSQYPSAITGSGNVCLGGTAALYDTVSGGTWMSLNPGVATIGATTGVVSGITLGRAIILYQMPGCSVSTTVAVNPLPVVFSVTGGGSHCASDTGVHIGLSGSTIGVDYMVYRGSTGVGAFSGTGTMRDLGLYTVAGGYVVRGTITATGCSINMSGAATVNVTPSVTPAVSLNISPNDTVCAGTATLFTTTTLNGGATPAYRWLVNGVPVAVAGSYSFIPTDRDSVTVEMASSLTCPYPAIVRSSKVMTVLPFGRPSVNVVALPNDTVCKSEAVTIMARADFGGAAPVFTWVKNTYVMPGVTGPAFTYVPNDGDIVWCKMASNYQCLLANTDTSNIMRIHVVNPVTPVVTITGNYIVGRNKYDTLTASVAGAMSPTYQWYINGLPMSGATSATFIHNNYSYPQEDSVSCIVTNHGVCTVAGHQWIFIESTTAGIANVTADDLNIIPNPNKGDFRIVGNMVADAADVNITDMAGRVIYHTKSPLHNSRLNTTVHFDNAVANGMYLLTVTAGEVSKVFHVVVER